jgi:hypothetical protein
MQTNLALPKRKKEQKVKGLPPRVGRRTNPRSGKIDKYARYRLRKGLPRGPGVPGNKSGRNASL